MVHQSSLWCKDLAMCHFIASSTSVRHARVINWNSVWIVLCCCVQCVEIYAEKRTFADGINILFLFEENSCRLIPITSRSLWWTCFIAKYMWAMVSVFQKLWLWDKTRRKTRKMEHRETNSDLWNCKHCWTKMIHEHEKTQRTIRS